jgi:hypothetical protein
MEIIYKRKKDAKQIGLGLDRQRVLLKGKHKCFNYIVIMKEVASNKSNLLLKIISQNTQTLKLN